MTSPEKRIQHLVTMDQEVRGGRRELVVTVDGINEQLLGEPPYDVIPEGSLLVADMNALMYRVPAAEKNNGKFDSFAPAWADGEALDEFLRIMREKGVTVRVVPNHTFGGKNGVTGGKDAVFHLYRAIKAEPARFLSKMRSPRSPRSDSDRDESRDLHWRANETYRRHEDLISSGVEPPNYDFYYEVAKNLFAGDERELMGMPKTNRGSMRLSRLLTAVACSVLDEDGNVLTFSDGTPITADYARRHIARLHGMARGAGVGGPIRACFRRMGRADNREEMKARDRLFMRLARELISLSLAGSESTPNSTEAFGLPRRTGTSTINYQLKMA